MLHEYPFPSIEINGKDISIHQIVSDLATPQTAFEADTFAFIKTWLSETQTFNFLTSGSTGPPKLISFSKEQLKKSAHATIRFFNLRPGKAVLICLNPRFVAGKMMIVRAFENNMKIIAVEPKANPLEFITDTSVIELIALVPLQLASMITAGYSDALNKLRTILVGGAPINEVLRTQIQKQLKTRVWATFGMTETLSHIALQNLINPSDEFVALPGVKFTQERGCLVIHRAGMPTVTTTDLVELINENAFKWLGRLDNIINSGGIKVIPEQLEIVIERAFRCLNIPNSFFVAGFPDEKLGEKVILLIENYDLSVNQRNEVENMIIKEIGKYAVPKRIISLKRFKMTKSHKISRLEILKDIRETL